MKKILSIFIFCLLVLSPRFAHAGNYTYTGEFTKNLKQTIQISSDTTTAIITITDTNTLDSDTGVAFGVYGKKITGRNPHYDDKRFGDILHAKAKQTTVETFTVTGLTQNTLYYLVMGTSKEYQFRTDGAVVSNNNGSTLFIAQEKENQGKVRVLIKTPITETRTLSLDFKNTSGQSVLTQSIPADATKTTSTTEIIYSFSLGDLNALISPGLYQVRVLAQDATNGSVSLIGPSGLNLLTTAVASAKPTYDSDDKSITVHGKLDPATHPDFRQFKITFDWGLTKDISDNKGPASIAKFEDNGSYSFTFQTDPSTSYYVRQTIVGTAGQQVQTTDFVNSSTGIIPTSGTDQQAYQAEHSYRLLSPLPGLTYIFDPDYCAQYTTENGALPEGAICDVNDFINYIMKLLIGLAGVTLVLRIMYEGYRLMTTDVPFVQANAKSGLSQSALGLALALTAWIILNTINPQLVSNGISLNDVAAGVESFTVSGGASFDGKPIKINFNSEAYPAACVASNKTGVSASLILAIFDQETSSGAGGINGTGRCTMYNTRMYDADRAALPGIASELGIALNATPVSCALKKSDGSYNGYGGAIGYAQALPTTWNSYKTEAKTNLNKTTALDPWKINDALMFVGVFMKHHNGIASPYNGACDYFGKCSFGGVDYAAQVVSRKETFEKEIADKINTGAVKDCKEYQ